MALGAGEEIRHGLVTDNDGRVVPSTHAGSPATIADGSDVTLGATTDAAVTTSTTGTISGKIRGLIAILTGTGGGGQVQGNVASGATDSGNPLKIGGIYKSTKDVLTTGQRGNAQLGTRGGLLASIYSNSDDREAGVVSSGDASGQSQSGLITIPYNAVYNGTSWDRLRANIDTAALITGTAATATVTGTDQTNYNARGVVVVYDCTAVTAAGSFTVSIQGKDAASGKYYTILTGAARSTTGTDVLTIYPGVTVAANTAVSTVLPRVWRVVATYNSGTDQTFTVGASVIL